MNWKDIKISEDGTHFIFQGEKIFSTNFINVLKFHDPGIAPVQDSSGWFHININGNPLYEQRYDRVFGFYFERAAVIKDGKWFHLNTKGKRAYPSVFNWCGNYQQQVCVVRNSNDCYYHINIYGKKIYSQEYLYAGDFYDGYSCVKTQEGWKHIKLDGTDLNGKYFKDLGVYHKGFAIAKDALGWFHIDRYGNEIYSGRYLHIEPFYNGFSLVTDFENHKKIINENGRLVIIV